jgi:hypothetical protein
VYSGKIAVPPGGGGLIHNYSINDHYFNPAVLSPLPLVTKSIKKRDRPAQEKKQSKRKCIKAKKVKCKLTNEPRPSTSRATEIEVNIDEW